MRNVTARDCARAVSHLSSSPLDTVSSLAQREVSPTTRITAGVSGVLCACLLVSFVLLLLMLLRRHYFRGSGPLNSL